MINWRGLRPAVLCDLPLPLMTISFTDNKVVVKSCGEGKLKSKHLKPYIEAESGINSSMNVMSTDEKTFIVIELDSYSGMP